jgi:hypothetical protein
MKRTVWALASAGVLIAGAVLFLQRRSSETECLRDYTSSAAEPSSELREAFRQVLDPSNKDIPEGLPGVEYPRRRIAQLIKAKDADLVIVSYEETQLESRFAQAFNYFPQSRRAEPIPTPITSNMGHRMFLHRIEDAECGSKVKIGFRSCIECDDRDTYSLTAEYSQAAGKWSYPAGIVTHSGKATSESK